MLYTRMTKKKITKDKEARIHCKYAHRVLVPANAIDSPRPIPNDTLLRTTDGVLCDIHFIGCWNNADGRFNEELDELCMKEWNVRFNALRSMFKSRLGSINESPWGLIELEKV